MRWSWLPIMVLVFVLPACATDTTADIGEEVEAQHVWCPEPDARLELALRHDVVSRPELGQQTTGALTVPGAVYAVSLSSGIDNTNLPVCHLGVTRNTVEPSEYTATIDVTPGEAGARQVVMTWRQWSQHRFSATETNGQATAMVTSTRPGNAAGEVTLSDSQYSTRTVYTWFGRNSGESQSYPWSWDTSLSFESDYPEDGSVSWSLPGCHSPEQTLAAFAGIYCDHAFTRLGR